MSRSQLNGMLDESCHKEREGELDTALGIANDVYEVVRNYVASLQELRQGSTEDLVEPNLHNSTSNGEFVR